MNKNISIQRREVWDAEKSNLIVSLLLAVPLESLLPEERAMVFFMRNQAAPLSKMDLSLVVLGEEAMDTFNRLCDYSFIQEKIKLTAPARRKHDDLNIMLAIHDPAFSAWNRFLRRRDYEFLR